MAVGSSADTTTRAPFVRLPREQRGLGRDTYGLQLTWNGRAHLMALLPCMMPHFSSQSPNRLASASGAPSSNRIVNRHFLAAPWPPCFSNSLGLIWATGPRAYCGGRRFH